MYTNKPLLCRLWLKRDRNQKNRNQKKQNTPDLLYAAPMQPHEDDSAQQYNQQAHHAQLQQSVLVLWNMGGSL
jgi:hypothetical protein